MTNFLGSQQLKIWTVSVRGVHLRDVAARGHAAWAVVLDGRCSQAFVAFAFEVRLEDQ